MTKAFKILMLVILLPLSAHSTAMSTELSRCFGMKDTVKSFRAWRADYENFREQSAVMSFDDRFEVSNLGARRLVMQIETLRRQAQFTTEDGLLTTARRLFQDLDRNSITRESALPVLTSGLGKLIEKMQFTIDQAEIKHECELNFRPIGINPGAGVPATR